MSEAFLHYLWQFQYFDKNELKTTTGDPIQIFNPGYRNAHAGPDFSNARIKIADVEWVGSAEIHIHASGWMDHKHDRDASYENVVLHVVWKNDREIRRRDGSPLPTLELGQRVDRKLFIDYQKLVNSPESVPCAPYLPAVKEITKLAMVDKVMMSRLEAKSKRVFDILQKNHNDWQETCYQLLARNFGFKVNADPFQQLAQLLPYKVLRKHGDKLLHLEALLFGQAGFLEENADDEQYQLLKREYNLLRQKYQLSDRRLNKAQWKFLRLRPANFPTIRLAQLAALIYERPMLFSMMLETETYKAFVALFSIEQSSYWIHHYRFFKNSKEPVSCIGEASISNIIINTVVPLLVAYGKSKDDQRYIDRAIVILQQTPGENNAIITQWKSLGLKSKSAFDSQALIELQNNYCSKRRCLDCNIGISLINSRQQ
ncbi:DUF2851 family protein [Chryseolinea sp. H1M3-3]|uniref:DUF2851 family protein n=1 Tax=Chryseolinea sp. H1M3-3 TaxID=3034144 RepID=UPI0023EDD411|nr:DUF2851 family protein [Chryseolinea sp. H1M3-3]